MHERARVCVCTCVCHFFEKKESMGGGGVDKMLIAAAFVLSIISHNSNNSVCVCVFLKVHVSPSNDAVVTTAARGVPYHVAKN